MPKRILIFSLAYNPHVGGAEIAIKEITDRINPDDISFEMITLRFDSTLLKIEQIGNVLVHRIGFAKENPSSSDLVRFPLYINKILYPITAFLKARKLHKERPFDALWAMMSYMGFPIQFLRFLYPDLPYLLTLQEGDTSEHMAERKRIRLVAPLYRRVFRNAAVVQAISNFLANWAVEMGYSKDPIVVPNGVNIERFSSVPSERERYGKRQHLGYTQNDIVLIHDGRLVPKNALEDIIKSLKHIDERFKFLSVGAGPDLQKLKKLSKDIGVGHRVQFVDFVPNEEIPSYLNASDIFIRPSLSEGMGISFIQAMAAGVPVIATQEGGIKDFLFDPDKNREQKPTGLAVSPRSPREIANQIERYVKDISLRNRIVENASTLVKEKYDWDLIVRDMREKVFEELFTLDDARELVTFTP